MSLSRTGPPAHWRVRACGRANLHACVRAFDPPRTCVTVERLGGCFPVTSRKAEPLAGTCLVTSRTAEPLAGCSPITNTPVQPGAVCFRVTSRTPEPQAGSADTISNLLWKRPAS